MPMKTLIATSQFLRWLDHLRDLPSRARIQIRIQRLAQGNTGACRQLKHGVRELKMDFGPGYRAYFTERSDVLILLLCGGDKSSQSDDIAMAYRLAHETGTGHDYQTP